MSFEFDIVFSSCDAMMDGMAAHVFVRPRV